MSLSVNTYDCQLFNPFAYKTSAPANIPEISTAFLKGNPWVRALYPARAAFNTKVVNLHSCVKEYKELRDAVDGREAAIIKKAQVAQGLFRVRGY